MKTLLLSSSLLVLVISSVIGLSFYYFSDTSNSISDSSITITSTKVSDPGIRCFTTPCFFRIIELNFTVTNSVERTFNLSSDSLYSLHVVPDSYHSEILFNIFNYETHNTSLAELSTLPVGKWNDNYTGMLSLSRMPTSDEILPTTIKVQLTLGNDAITISVFALNLII